MNKRPKNRVSLCGSGFHHTPVQCDVVDPHPIKKITIPNDVLFVYSVTSTGMPVGLEMFNKCKAIKEKYPEWFKD